MLPADGAARATRGARTMLCAPTPTNLSVGDIKFEEHDYLLFAL